jgi:hypothetical protein
MTIAQQFQQIAQTLLERARAYYGDNLVTFAVYGSVARGTATVESDIDLLLVVRDLPQGRMPRIDAFTRNVETPPMTPLYFDGRTYPLRVSAVIRTPEEVALGSPLFLDMTEACLLLHDQGEFFANYLKALRAKMQAWGSEKRYLAGGYYWQLKPDLKPGEKIIL